jgi:hypothetical protein
MANIITAGNSTNGGTAISTDTSGTLNIVTGSGSGANAITIDASQAVTMPGTLAVTGAQTIGGNLTVTGTLTASGGVSGGITSGTAVSASGTSVTFTGIPSTVKRITVMFNGVSISGTSAPLIQIGSGSVTNSGYVSSASISTSTTANSSTAGFVASFGSGNATFTVSGSVVLTLISNNTWVASGLFANTVTFIFTTSFGGVSPNLAGALDRVRITTVNGTDTFDAGTINIFYE